MHRLEVSGAVRHILGDPKETWTFEMRSGSNLSWQHCGTGTLSYRQPRHLVIMDQWNGQQRSVTITMFYMFGFFKSSRFLGHSVYVVMRIYIYIYVVRRQRVKFCFGCWGYTLDREDVVVTCCCHTWSHFAVTCLLVFSSLWPAEPNSQFRGIYIRNNLIRIRASFICKLSGTPE
jgi:hypothetical protein